MRRIALLVVLVATTYGTALSCDSIPGCTGNELQCANGEGVRVASSANNKFGTGDFTVEWWFTAQATSTLRGMLGKVNPNGSWIMVAVDTGEHVVLSVRSTDGYTARIVSRPGSINGQWRHLAVVRSGAGLSLSIDENLEGETFFPTGSDIANDSDLLIGAMQTTLGYAGFTGRLDEVRIWNAAISADSLACLRFDRLIGNEPHLVAYYPFDDSTIRRTTCDRSRNQQDGKLGTLTSIVGPTRTIPPPIATLESTLSFASDTTCSDTLYNIVHITSSRFCGTSVQSISFSGPDALSFSTTAVTPHAVAFGDTFSFSVRCIARSADQSATLVIGAGNCGENFTVALSCSPPRISHASSDKSLIDFADRAAGSIAIDSLHIRNTASYPDTIDAEILGGPFTVETPTPIVIASGTEAAVMVAYRPSSPLASKSTLVLQSRLCGTPIDITLTGNGVLAMPETVTVCAAFDSLTNHAGDTVDVALICTPPLTSFAGDSVILRFSYDARQIDILNVHAPCSTIALDDRPDSNLAHVTIISCGGMAVETLATMRIIALAPDSTVAAFDIQSASPSSLVYIMPCAQWVTVIPGCASPNVVYSTTQTTLFNVTPNPVAATGTIGFILQEATTVQIVLYDLFGRRVSTLTDRFYMPGSYSTTLNAATLQLQPGAYYYVMRSGAFHGVGRMTVLR